MKRYIARRLMQGVGPALHGGDDRVLPRPADRQSGRPDAARGCHGRGPRGADPDARPRRLDPRPVRDLRRQGDARRSRHLDPHEAAGGRGLLRPPAQHAGADPLGDAARHDAGHSARRGGGAPSRQHARPRGGHGRGAGRRHAELLARRAADLRLQRRAGLAAVGPHGRAGALSSCRSSRSAPSWSPASCASRARRCSR